MRIILILFITSLFSLNSFASHLMGGEITWQCLKSGPNVGQYVFTLKVYRDCNGITVSTISQTLTVWGNPALANITVDFVSQTDVSPQCNPAASGNSIYSCANGDLGAVEEYIFQSQPIAMPGTPPADGWHFTWNSCCRNAAIVNLATASEGFTLRASMYPYTDPVTGLQLPADPCFDSSPNFKEQPKTILCTGFPFAYSHNASDEELDELVYSWGDPLDDDLFGGVVFNPGTTPSILSFAPPYSVNSPLPGNPTLDAATGEVNYDANTPGFFVTCVKVQAFKCNQLVAEVFREVQVVLVTCVGGNTVGGLNSPPLVSEPFTDTSTGIPTFETTVFAGDFVSFNIEGTDADVYTGGVAQELTMEVSGGAFSNDYVNTINCLNPPCATFNNGFGLTPPFSSPGIVSGNFEWQTSCNHVAAIAGCGATSNVFTFLVKVHDDFCPAYGITIATIKVTVLPAPIDWAPDIRCASVINDNDVEITWNHLPTSQPSTVYSIFHSSNPSGPFTFLDSIIYPDSTYIHTGSSVIPSSRQEYYYLTSHSECADESEPSDTISTIKLDLSAINNGTQASLNWNPIHQPNLSTSSSQYMIEALTSGNWEIVDSTSNLNSIFDARTCDSYQYLLVSLEDQSGCISNSSVEGAVLRDTISPNTPLISDVSVNSDGNAVINWTCNSLDVEKYAIYWKDPDGAWITIDSVFGFGNTSYTFLNSNASNNYESYQIRALDSCDNASSWSLEHNSINLDPKIDICNYSIDLSWNEYINFTGGLSHYKLFIQVTDLNNNISNSEIRFDAFERTYILSNIQEGYNYYLYIEAYNTDSTLIARSDQEDISINLPNRPKFNYIEYASVLHNSNKFGYVDISCIVDLDAEIDYYEVYRSLKDDSLFQYIGSIPFPFNSNNGKVRFIDETANTDKYFYEYQIYPVDTCGDIISTGTYYDSISGINTDTSYARTIFLNSKINLDYSQGLPSLVPTSDLSSWGDGSIDNQYINTLDFNEYDKWLGDVSQYKLYRSVNRQPFSLSPIYIYDRVNNPDEPLSFIDIVTNFGDGNGRFCYYIEAIEGVSNPYGPVQGGSLSNVSCVSQTPILYVPNSFTPNNDEHNEIFLPITFFVSEEGYSFTIYNRDGMQVFKTEDPKKGWDGRYNGQILQDGVYVYQIRYINGVGDLVEKTDIITLLK